MNQHFYLIAFIVDDCEGNLGPMYSLIVTNKFSYVNKLYIKDLYISKNDSPDMKEKGNNTFTSGEVSAHDVILNQANIHEVYINVIVLTVISFSPFYNTADSKREHQYPECQISI